MSVNMLCWRKLGFKVFSAATNSCCGTGSVQAQNLRKLSSVAGNLDYFSELPVQASYTSLKYPREHTLDQIGMWYTLDPDTAKQLFHHDGLTRKFKELNDVLCTTSFMIREPAISVIDYVNRSNLEHPPNKFILYGRDGTGKTLSLAHIIHHFMEERWVLVHAAVPARWSTLYKEIVPSSTRPGFYDHTMDASLWLQQFKEQNGTLLENPALTTSEAYQWTQREATEAGSTILALVDYGISRPRYASECVLHLTSELKKHAVEGRIKLAVVIDGVNSLFSPTSTFQREDRSVVPCHHFTLFEAFAQMLQTDWKNGVIVGSVDIIMSTKERRKSYLPRYLLGKKGWETLDPFVPVPVDAYSDLELDSAVAFYLDRRWLQHPAARTVQARDELAFTSARNPAQLIRIINAH